MQATIQRLAMLAGLIGLTCGGAVSTAMAESLVLEGQARVVDNTTLEIWGHRIRLADIVPLDQASAEGREGQLYLEQLVSGVMVRCVASAMSVGETRIGHCSAGRLDIGATLVQLGYARRQTARQAAP